MPREATLGVALKIDERSMREQLATIARGCVQLGAKQRLAALVTPRFWGRVGRSIGETMVSKLSSIPLSTVLVDGWLKIQELRAYADPERHPPGEPSDVALVKHTVTSPHTVTIELLVNGAKATAIDIDVEIELELEGAILHVLDGKINAITIGSARASVRIEHEGRELTSIPLHPIDLPDIQLDSPIPIALPDRYAAVAIAPDARVPSLTR